jgi:hypothetical protein
MNSHLLYADDALCIVAGVYGMVVKDYRIAVVMERHISSV